MNENENYEIYELTVWGFDAFNASRVFVRVRSGQTVGNTVRLIKADESFEIFKVLRAERISVLDFSME